MPSADGWRIGKYTILRRIATGGMAELFLARADGPAGFAKLVALKQILPGHADNRGFVEMFLDEARVAARLNHPNIVQIFELGQADGAYFIAMEYIHGHTVFELLRAGAQRNQFVPLDVALGVVIAACDGLGFAHGQRADDGRALELVHRDVSPQNLLASYDGAVKLVDFGIARAADQLHHTVYGQVKGKPSYMSPEQAVGGRVDLRTDIYALGVVLHELLTGRRLFGGRALGVPSLEARQAIAPPSQAQRGLPPELDAIALKALAYHPGDRYASCEELRAELERVMARGGLVNSSARRAELLAAWFPGEAEARPVIRSGDGAAEATVTETGAADPEAGGDDARTGPHRALAAGDETGETPTPLTAMPDASFPPAASTAYIASAFGKTPTGPAPTGPAFGKTPTGPAFGKTPTGPGFSTAPTRAFSQSHSSPFTPSPTPPANAFAPPGAPPANAFAPPGAPPANAFAPPGAPPANAFAPPDPPNNFAAPSAGPFATAPPSAETAFIAAPSVNLAAEATAFIAAPSLDPAAATAFIAAPSVGPAASSAFTAAPSADPGAATAFTAAPSLDPGAPTAFTAAPLPAPNTGPTPTPVRKPRLALTPRLKLQLAAAAGALALAAAVVWIARAVSSPPAPRAIDPAAAPSPRETTRPPLDVVFDDDDPPSHPARGMLSLDTVPFVDVFYGSQPLGRTPLRSVRLPTGRRRLHLTDHDLGIDSVIEVEIAAGHTTERHVAFATGTLRIDTPAGTEVQIDSLPPATAPVAPLSLFEGTHDVVLTWHPKSGPVRRRHERVAVHADEQQVLVRDLSRD